MNEHPQFDEDFDLYAIGALDGDERESIELHLAHCDQCARRVEEARGRVAVLAFAAPAEVPNPEVRERLLRRVRATPVRTSFAGAASGRLGRWAVPVFALAALVFAILYGRLRSENTALNSRVRELEAQHRLLQEQTQRARVVLDVLTAPDTLNVTLVKGPAAPAPQGKAFYNPQKGLLFYAANMPQLSPEKTYELWVIPTAGNPIAAGTFNVDAKGNGDVVLPPLPSGISAKALAVTVEPAGGRTQPSTTPVLVGPVS